MIDVAHSQCIVVFYSGWMHSNTLKSFTSCHVIDERKTFDKVAKKLLAEKTNVKCLEIREQLVMLPLCAVVSPLLFSSFLLSVTASSPKTLFIFLSI